MDLIGTDTETGGIHPSIHALLAIGACCNWSGETFEVYITPESQPGKVVEAQAAAKNGYTPELWAERGAVDLTTGIRRFASWLQARRDERKYAKIVCHHLAFDKSFLLEAERVTGIEMPGRYDWRCSLLKLAELMDEGVIERGSASLDRLKELSGWSAARDAAHNALQDAQIAMHGYFWLLDRAKDAERALSELAASRLERIKLLSAQVTTEDAKCGVALIALERQRQVTAEGWTAAHDDGHDYGQLAAAALVYVDAHLIDITYKPEEAGRLLDELLDLRWPFEEEAFKLSPSIRMLTKAGALIAAEIDRVQREEDRADG